MSQIHFLDALNIWVFPKIGVPPKWMVYNGKPYEQMDDLGENTPIFGNIHMKSHGICFNW